MKGKVKKEFRRGRSKQRAARPVVEQGSRQREKAGPGRALGYIHGSPPPAGRWTDIFSPQPARKRKRKRIESARARARTMAALRLAVRRFCDRALGRSAGIYELKAAKEFPDIDPGHLKAARKFPKLRVKDVDATALNVFKILRQSPVDGHVRMTLKTLAEIQEEE
ncbi:hypothetical protein VPH35_011659 [Triticum aestivum]